MTTYFVDGDRADDTGDGLTWAAAKKTLTAALAATTPTLVILKSTVNQTITTGTTFNIPDGCHVVAATADDTNVAYTPTPMGEGTWVGNSAGTSYAITISCSSACIEGVTFRVGGTTNASMAIASGASANLTMDNCCIWLGTTNSAAQLQLGTTAAANETFIRFSHCGFRFGATAHGFNCGGAIVMEGCSILSSGTTPTNLFVAANNSTSHIDCYGCDFSLVGSNLVGVQTQGHKKINFSQCEFPSGITVMAPQTTYNNASQCEVFVHDCSYDNGTSTIHYAFEHYNNLGSTVIDASIYANDGAEYNAAGTKHSWKVSSTANATFANPYISPWISVHHEGTSAITPNLECVRSGSATAYQNDELWSEWMYKGTDNSTKGTIDRTDKMTLAGSAADQTTGALNASGWTGENATAWFGKLAPASAITPYEIGDLCARVCIGVASVTDLYVDPTIRGRS